MSGRTLQDAIELVGMAAGRRGYRHYDGSGAVYVGDVEVGPPEASFTDWGLAESVTVILNAVAAGRLIPIANLRFVDDVKPETTQEDRDRLRMSREFQAEMERERLGDKAYFEQGVKPEDRG